GRLVEAPSAALGAEGLEVEPQLELNNPATRIVRAGHRRITVGGASLSEVSSIGSDGLQRTVYAGDAANEEVRPVEGIQELNTPFEVCSLCDANPLHQVQIKSRCHWAVKNQPVAQFTGRGWWSNVRRVRIKRAAVFKRRLCVGDD